MLRATGMMAGRPFLLDGNASTESTGPPSYAEALNPKRDVSNAVPPQCATLGKPTYMPLYAEGVPEPPLNIASHSGYLHSDDAFRNHLRRLADCDYVPLS